MAEKKEGPSISIDVSCSGCKYLETEHFAVQDDTGFHKYCTHSGQKKDTGAGYTWKCPEWCPVFPMAKSRIRLALAEIQQAPLLKPDPECSYCGGSGERLWHSDDCRSDDCALNGDLDSCQGKLDDCPCLTPVTSPMEAV